MRSKDYAFSFLLIAIGFLVIVLASQWYYAPCGPAEVKHWQSEFETMLAHFQTIENYASSNVGPDHNIPESLLLHVESDIAYLEETQFNSCVLDAASSLVCALANGKSYYENRSLGHPRDTDLQRKNIYESCLKNYYADMRAIEACQPFCQWR